MKVKTPEGGMHMNVKKLWIILACVVLAVALVVAVCLLIDKDPIGSIDSDGDGRPDSVDEEPDDNLDTDHEVKVDGLVK